MRVLHCGLLLKTQVALEPEDGSAEQYALNVGVFGISQAWPKSSAQPVIATLANAKATTASERGIRRRTSSCMGASGASGDPSSRNNTYAGRRLLSSLCCVSA